jgi:hypothetical protein
MASAYRIGNVNDIKGLKPGKPRHSKKKKGNAPSKTARRGNGKKL